MSFPSVSCAALCLCLVAASARAYIDPGSGSFLLQGLVAGILGLGVTLKLYWHRIFGRRTSRQDQRDDED